jgi:exopolyphosphatase/guanosine-5'-triphosphate,3'-diphosphate pyrophosphatase
VRDEQAERHGAQIFAAKADRETVRGRILFCCQSCVNARRQGVTTASSSLTWSSSGVACASKSSPAPEEGRLAYLAVKAGLGLAEGALAIFDTGGGSTQFTFGSGSKVDEQFSLNVGAVRFTEKYGLAGAISPDQLKVAQDAIASEFTRIDRRPSPDGLVGMGGAITNIAAVKHQMAKYDPDVIQGSTIERSEVERQIEMYRSKTIDERRAIVGLQPKRAHVILAGTCIVKIVMDKIGKDKLSVSDRGLRHGRLIDRFAG